MKDQFKGCAKGLVYGDTDTPQDRPKDTSLERIEKTVEVTPADAS